MGQFPGNLELTIVPEGYISKFIQSKDIIFPATWYQNFNGGDSQGLVSTQLMTAFNIF